jgi:hypothetical protein
MADAVKPNPLRFGFVARINPTMLSNNGPLRAKPGASS